jgi:TolA-binding protein
MPFSFLESRGNRMAAERHPRDGKARRDLLSEALDFGFDAPEPVANGLSERIRKVKEKIEELNQRIQRLTTRID